MGVPADLATAIMDHPARIARLAYHEMRVCIHEIDAHQRCTKCLAPFWAIQTQKQYDEDQERIKKARARNT